MGLGRVLGCFLEPTRLFEVPVRCHGRGTRTGMGNGELSPAANPADLEDTRTPVPGMAQPRCHPMGHPTPICSGLGAGMVHLSTPKSLAWGVPPSTSSVPPTPRRHGASSPAAPGICQSQPSPSPRSAVSLPVLLAELQHHVVGGHAEGPPGVLVLPALAVLHVGGGHGAVVGVVVHMQGAAVVPRHVELDVWGDTGGCPQGGGDWGSWGCSGGAGEAGLGSVLC